MKVTEIFNKGNLKKRVVVYEERYVRTGDTRYRVDVYQIGKRGYETLKEQMSFNNKVASLRCAKIILNHEGVA